MGRFPPDADIRAWAARALGCKGVDARELPPLVHGFTHFTLEISPWRIDLPTLPRVLAEPAWLWLRLGDIAAAALPAPVRRILESLSE